MGVHEIQRPSITIIVLLVIDPYVNTSINSCYLWQIENKSTTLSGQFQNKSENSYTYLCKIGNPYTHITWSVTFLANRKRTNNDLQNTTQKTNGRAIRTSVKTGGESMKAICVVITYIFVVTMFNTSCQNKCYYIQSLITFHLEWRFWLIIV
jgi:hypothetical protein